MEAHISRNCVTGTFLDIRLAAIALAPAISQRYHIGLPEQEERPLSCMGGRLIFERARDRSPWGKSMDRLLRYFMGKFIRRGAMTFTTANGMTFTCGDGTGEPVAVRFLTAAAERRVLFDPELALGEVYMDGTFVVDRGSLADVLAILLAPPEFLPRWAKLQWWLR